MKLCFLLLSLCALLNAQTEVNGELCEVFAIRREGVVFLRIDTSDTQNVVIPDEFVLVTGSVQSTEIYFNDQYVFSVGSDDQVTIRQRLVDNTNGLWIIPRPLRSQMVDGQNVLDAEGNLVNLATISLYDLKPLLAARNAASLALQGITDPFADTFRYDPSGNICHDVKASASCLSVSEELFSVTLATASAPAQSYFDSLTAGVAATTQNDDASASLSVKDSSSWMGASLENAEGATPGEAQFRLTDDEVEDVFWLEAILQESHEVVPGVSVSIHGWRGGQVMDFVLSNGQLTDGHIVVGPHPSTDPWDVVYYGAKRFGSGGNNGPEGSSRKRQSVDSSPFSDLEVSSPGPVLRFGYGRNTRVYIVNSLSNTEFQVSWVGQQLPHDQDGSTLPPTAEGSTHVFEFVVSNYGTKIYTDTHGAVTGLFGGVLTTYPDDIDQGWDRRYAHTFFNSNDQIFTMNGESFPGTVRRLGGWFRDRIDIISSYPASDGSGDTIVHIADVPRPSIVTGNLQPELLSECPAYGGPIVNRPGTGCLSGASGHFHSGHQISSTTFSPGTWVHISGHSDRGVGIEYSINGAQLAIREGDSPDLLRIKKVGDGTNGGIGGQLSIWRLHKVDFTNPQSQNNGFGGSYMRFNYGEKIAISYLNPGAGIYPIHLHGHQYEVIAVDGELLGDSLIRHTYPLHEGSTFDVVVTADNPNHYDYWLHFAHNPEYLVNSFGGSTVSPGGLISYIDYTGFAQQKLSVTALGETTPFSAVSPICKANTNLLSNLAGRDVLGWEANLLDSKVLLVGVAEIPFDNYLNRSIVTTGDWAWEFVSGPDGNDQDPILEPVGIDYEGNFVYQARGFISDGDYTFRFVLNATNVETTNSSYYVGCTDEVTLTVNTSLVVDELMNTRTYFTGAPLSVRLPGEDSGPDRGHISFELFTGQTESFPDEVVVSMTVVSQNPPNFSPLIDFSIGDGISFNRWPVQNSYSHIWYSDLPFTGELSAPNPSDMPDYTLGRVGWDSRVATPNNMTYARGTVNVDISPSVSLASDLPERVEILLPMYQGVIDWDGTFDFNNDTETSGTPSDFITPGSDFWVYFIITESSDAEFCGYFGCTYAPALFQVPTEATLPASSQAGTAHPSITSDNRPAHVRSRATTFLFPNILPFQIPYFDTDVNSYPSGYFYEDDNFDVDVAFDDGEYSSRNRYSPLRRFTWTSPSTGEVKLVIANMPFVFWLNNVTYDIDGDGSNSSAATIFDAQLSVYNVEYYQSVLDPLNIAPNSTQQLSIADNAQTVIDSTAFFDKLPVYTGGCDSRFRGSDPSWTWTSYFSPLFESTGTTVGALPGNNGFDPAGPLGCTSIATSYDTHYGGQLTRSPNFEHMLVAFKAHKAHGSIDGRYPFYILTDTSDLTTAQLHGVAYAPRLNVLGEAGVSHPAVSSLKIISNGLAQSSTSPGPSGLHPALLDITTDTVKGYTPLRYVSSLYWNCGEYYLPYGDLYSSDYTSVPFHDILDGNQADLRYSRHNLYDNVQVQFITPEFVPHDLNDDDTVCNPSDFTDVSYSDYCWSDSAIDFSSGYYAVPFNNGPLPPTLFRYYDQDFTNFDTNGEVAAEWFSNYQEFFFFLNLHGSISIGNAPLDNGGYGGGQLFPHYNEFFDSGPLNVALIAAWWGNYLDAEVSYGYRGTVLGQREFFVEWRDAQLDPGSLTIPFDQPTTATYQIRFFEATPWIVEVHYLLAPYPQLLVSSDITTSGLDEDPRPFFSAGAQTSATNGFFISQPVQSWATLFYGQDHLTPAAPEPAQALLSHPELYEGVISREVERWYSEDPLYTEISLSPAQITYVAGQLWSFDISWEEITTAPSSDENTAISMGISNALSQIFPGYTAYVSSFLDTDDTPIFRVGFYQQVAVRYSFPRTQNLAAQAEDDPQDDGAQLLGNVKTTVCMDYVTTYAGSSGQLWSGQENPLVWSGVLIETEYPGGSYIKGTGDFVTADFQPVIWNSPQVFTFDFSAFHDENNTLLVSNDQVWNQIWQDDSEKVDGLGNPIDEKEIYLFPGAWVILWNNGNLNDLPEIDPINGSSTTPPVSDNIPEPTTSHYINPLAVLAGRQVDYVTANTWYNDDRFPPTDCTTCTDPGVCAPCWQRNNLLYPDLTTDPVLEYTPTTPETVLFVILEADDAPFASLVGATYVPSLSNADTRAVDTNIRFPRYVDELAGPDAGSFNVIDNKFVFAHTPGLVGDNNGRGPIADEMYSPIKRFTYNGRVVTVNAPMVSWGSDAGQQLVYGNGFTASELSTSTPTSTYDFVAPCSPDIRSNNASDIWLNYGPPGCFNNGDPNKALSPMMFHNGGQLLDLNQEKWAYFSVPHVTMKLHKGIGHDARNVPYYTIWDTSDFSLSGLMGVPFVPRLQYLGSASKAVSQVRAFANGASDFSGGPGQFEQSLLTAYSDEQGYSAFSHLTWIFYNCYNRIDTNNSFVLQQANIGAGAVPPTDFNDFSIAGFNPYDEVNYDPYQVRSGLKGLDCTDWVAQVAGFGHHKWSDVDSWISQRLAFETESPAGDPLDNIQNYFTIVNMPQHVYADLRQPYSQVDVSDITPTQAGAHIQFFGLDDSLTWYVSGADDVLSTYVSDLVGTYGLYDAGSPFGYTDPFSSDLAGRVLEKRRVPSSLDTVAEEYGANVASLLGLASASLPQGVTPVYSCDVYLNTTCDYYSDPLSPSSIEAATILVRPGDRVTIWVRSAWTSHGVLFWVPTVGDVVYNMTAAALYRFFDVDYMYDSFSMEISNAKFQPSLSGYWFGSSNTYTGLVKLFSGVVKDTALGADQDGYDYMQFQEPRDQNTTSKKRSVPANEVWRKNRQELWFTDPAFGPANMRVRLVAFSGFAQPEEFPSVTEATYSLNFYKSIQAFRPSLAFYRSKDFANFLSLSLSRTLESRIQTMFDSSRTAFEALVFDMVGIQLDTPTAGAFTLSSILDLSVSSEVLQSIFSDQSKISAFGQLVRTNLDKVSASIMYNYQFTPNSFAAFLGSRSLEFVAFDSVSSFARLSSVVLDKISLDLVSFNAGRNIESFSALDLSTRFAATARDYISSLQNSRSFNLARSPSLQARSAYNLLGQSSLQNVVVLQNLLAADAIEGLVVLSITGTEVSVSLNFDRLSYTYELNLIPQTFDTAGGTIAVLKTVTGGLAMVNLDLASKLSVSFELSRVSINSIQRVSLDLAADKVATSAVSVALSFERNSFALDLVAVSETIYSGHISYYAAKGLFSFSISKVGVAYETYSSGYALNALGKGVTSLDAVSSAINLDLVRSSLVFEMKSSGVVLETQSDVVVFATQSSGIMSESFDFSVNIDSRSLDRSLDKSIAFETFRSGVVLESVSMDLAFESFGIGVAFQKAFGVSLDKYIELEKLVSIDVYQYDLSTNYERVQQSLDRFQDSYQRVYLALDMRQLDLTQQLDIMHVFDLHQTLDIQRSIEFLRSIEIVHSYEAVGSLELKQTVNLLRTLDLLNTLDLAHSVIFDVSPNFDSSLRTLEVLNNFDLAQAFQAKISFEKLVELEVYQVYEVNRVFDFLNNLDLHAAYDMSHNFDISLQSLETLRSIEMYRTAYDVYSNLDINLRNLEAFVTLEKYQIFDRTATLEALISLEKYQTLDFQNSFELSQYLTLDTKNTLEMNKVFELVQSLEVFANNYDRVLNSYDVVSSYDVMRTMETLQSLEKYQNIDRAAVLEGAHNYDLLLSNYNTNQNYEMFQSLNLQQNFALRPVLELHQNFELLSSLDLRPSIDLSITLDMLLSYDSHNAFQNLDQIRQLDQSRQYDINQQYDRVELQYDSFHQQLDLSRVMDVVQNMDWAQHLDLANSYEVKQSYDLLRSINAQLNLDMKQTLNLLQVLDLNHQLDFNPQFDFNQQLEQTQQFDRYQQLELRAVYEIKTVLEQLSNFDLAQALNLRPDLDFQISMELLHSIEVLQNFNARANFVNIEAFASMEVFSNLDFIKNLEAVNNFDARANLVSFEAFASMEVFSNLEAFANLEALASFDRVSSFELLSNFESVKSLEAAKNLDSYRTFDSSKNLDAFISFDSFRSSMDLVKSLELYKVFEISQVFEGRQVLEVLRAIEVVANLDQIKNFDAFRTMEVLQALDLQRVYESQTSLEARVQLQLDMLKNSLLYRAMDFVPSSMDLHESLEYRQIVDLE